MENISTVDMTGFFGQSSSRNTRKVRKYKNILHFAGKRKMRYFSKIFFEFCC